jgi:hypothetical protein
MPYKNNKYRRHTFHEPSSTNVAVLKDTHLVLIPKLVVGPGGSQHFVVCVTMELE